MPVLSNTSGSPWHTHSAVPPGKAATQRLFEYGNDTARKCTTRSTPATTARAWPKSTCALPGAHSSSAKPSDCARCSCLQRLIQRCTNEYEPVNPHSATSLSYTRVAVWRCLTGMRRSAAGQPSTMAAYPSSTSDLPGRASFDGLGEQSPWLAYLTTVVRDTPSFRDISLVAQALAVELPDTLSDTHRCRHFLDSREPSVWLTGTRESIKEPDDAGVLIPPAPSPPAMSKLNAQDVQKQVPTPNTFILITYSWVLWHDWWWWNQ